MTEQKDEAPRHHCGDRFREAFRSWVVFGLDDAFGIHVDDGSESISPEMWDAGLDERRTESGFVYIPNRDKLNALLRTMGTSLDGVQW